MACVENKFEADKMASGGGSVFITDDRSRVAKITGSALAGPSDRAALASRAVAPNQIRLLTVPLGNPIQSILQVGEVARDERRFTSLLFLSLGAVLVIGLPLGGLGGWWLAGRAAQRDLSARPFSVVAKRPRYRKESRRSRICSSRRFY